MGFTTAALIGLGVAQAGTQIAGGVAASSEAKYNAKIKEQQANMISAQADLEASQYDRQIARAGSTLTARVGKSGLMMSGSPMAALIDMTTQMELDKAVGQYNYEYQKRFALSQADQYKRNARTAMFQGVSGAFTSLLQTGAMVGMARMNPSLQSTNTNRYMVNDTAYPSYIRR